MKAKLIIIILAVASLTFCSCREMHPDLQRAEAIMESAPDSALALLEAINGSELNGEARALHALLLTQALDKNYIDVTDDSLINIACDYYALSDDVIKVQKSTYYYALIHYYAGDYEVGMAAALKAEQLAGELNDNERLAQVCALLSLIYAETLNTEKALEYSLKGHSYAIAADKKKWIANSFTTIAKRHLRVGNYDRTLLYIDSARVAGGIDEDYANNLSILAHAGRNDYQAIDSVLNSAPDSTQFDPTAYAYIALAKFLLGDDNGFNRYLQLAESNAEEAADTVEIAIVKKEVSLRKNNYKEVIAAQRILLDYTGRYFLNATTRPIQQVQVEFEKNRVARVEASRQIEKLRARSTIAILFLTVGVISLLAFFTWRNMRQKLSIQEYKLNVFVDEYESLKRAAETRETQLSQTLSATELREVISQFSWIEKLGNIYIYATNTNSAQKVAYKKLEDSIKKIRGIDFQKTLESIIDNHRNNIITRIRKSCPKIIESEISLIVYSCVGFSSRVIACLLDKNENAIYSQKYRIHKKLLQEYPDIIDELADIFG